MVEKIAFQSIGGVEGLYLPSKSHPKYGSLLTDYGIFPAETSEQTRRKFPKIAGYPMSESKGETKLKFLTWVIGTQEPPYYRFDLRSVHLQFPEWIEKDNWFYLQGIIAERTPEKVSLRMQLNYWENYSEDKIQASINYLQIKNCPSNVRKSQFWGFTTSFQDGFLHCQTAKRLATATETQKILKSWRTDPIDSSHYEETMKKYYINI